MAVTILRKDQVRKKDGCLYEKVAARLRGEIKSLKPGDVLAPQRALAERYSVSYLTMRKVLDTVSREGIIKAHHGVGTVVTDRMNTGEMAIVIKPQLLGAESSPYFKKAAQLLTEKLGETSGCFTTKFHTGRVTGSGEDFPRTLDLVDPGVVNQLRGVFSFHPLYEVVKKLEEKKVPLVTITGTVREDVPCGKHQLGFDYSDFLKLAIDHLAQRGCRRLGLIWSSNKRGRASDENQAKRFAQLVKNKGLETREEWMPFFEIADGPITEAGGYDTFMRFWKQSDRPDGLVVNDDILCWGVLRGVLQLGIKVPNDLKIVSEGNKGVAFPYHLPVTQVQFDVDEQIEKAIGLMLQLIRGETPKEAIVVLPGKLVFGGTT